MKFILLTTLLLSSCTTINRDSKEHYHKKHKGLHGFIPQKDNSIKKEALRAKLDPKAVERGKIAYGQYCYQCHGVNADGKGPLALKNNFRSANLIDAAKKIPNFKFYIKISQWKGEMPGWKNHINEQEINDIEQYLKSFLK